MDRWDAVLFFVQAFISFFFLFFLSHFFFSLFNESKILSHSILSVLIFWLVEKRQLPPAPLTMKLQEQACV